MTRAQLVQRLRQRIEDAERMNAIAPVASTLSVVLEEIENLEPEAIRKVPEGDRLLTAKDLAGRLQVPESYVYRHAADWPFTRRVGRKLRFSEQGFEKWLSLPKTAG